MKKSLRTTLIAAIVGAVCVSDLSAQRPGNQQGPGSRMASMMKMLPIVSALDADGDGEISAEEIENSVTALKALDKDGDGLLKSNELLPDRSRMRSSQGQRGRQRGGESRSDSGLKVGEMAPTFKLKSLDGKSETDLAEYNGKKPVVLFFGSYT